MTEVRSTDPLERLGPFTVEKPLARGGMSEVYLARNVGGFQGPERVVLKVWRAPKDVKPDSSKARDLLARLIEEGRLGTRLRHPSITRSYGVMHDREQDLYFMVQAFVDGVTFGDLMDFYAENDLRIPYNVVLRLLIPILQGLHYAYHDAQREDGRPLRVVHRDLKPDNLMLSFEGLPLLLDFGVARSTSLTRQVTVGDFVVGTRHYMAPEQVFEPDKVGHRSDLFSIGLILYELCALRPVFPRTRAIKEFAEALADFRFANYEQRIDARRYPGIREVLSKVLVADPRGRYPAAGDMAHDLEALLAGAPPEPSLRQFALSLKDDLAEAESANTMLEASAAAAAAPKHVVLADGDGPVNGASISTRGGIESEAGTAGEAGAGASVAVSKVAAASRSVAPAPDVRAAGSGPGAKAGPAAAVATAWATSPATNAEVSAVNASPAATPLASAGAAASTQGSTLPSSSGHHAPHPPATATASSGHHTQHPAVTATAPSGHHASTTSAIKAASSVGAAQAAPPDSPGAASGTTTPTSASRAVGRLASDPHQAAPDGRPVVESLWTAPADAPRSPTPAPVPIEKPRPPTPAPAPIPAAPGRPRSAEASEMPFHLDSPTRSSPPSVRTSLPGAPSAGAVQTPATAAHRASPDVPPPTGDGAPRVIRPGGASSPMSNSAPTVTASGTSTGTTSGASTGTAFGAPPGTKSGVPTWLLPAAIILASLVVGLAAVLLSR